MLHLLNFHAQQASVLMGDDEEEARFHFRQAGQYFETLRGVGSHSGIVIELHPSFRRACMLLGQLGYQPQVRPAIAMSA